MVFILWVEDDLMKREIMGFLSFHVIQPPSLSSLLSLLMFPFPIPGTFLSCGSDQPLLDGNITWLPDASPAASTAGNSSRPHTAGIQGDQGKTFHADVARITRGTSLSTFTSKPWTKEGEKASLGYLFLKDVPGNISVPYGVHPSLFASARSFEEDVSVVSIPVKHSGYFFVRLYFAETMYTLPQRRSFDVTVEGATVLKGYEPSRTKADVQEFVVPVTDGVVDIAFVRGEAGDPMVNAIAVSEGQSRAVRDDSGLTHISVQVDNNSHQSPSVYLNCCYHDIWQSHVKHARRVCPPLMLPLFSFFHVPLQVVPAPPGMYSLFATNSSGLVLGQ